MFWRNWRFRFGLLLFTISSLLLTAQALLLHEEVTIAKKALYGISFIPLQALILTLVINGWLSSREKRQRLEKMNIAIGVFFNAMGRELMKRLMAFAAPDEALQKHLDVQKDWSPQTFEISRRTLQKADLPVDLTRGNIEDLCQFLETRQPLVLDLLRNPHLLEHERFTNLLWAVSHLTEEISARGPSGLPLKEDRSHLEEDFRRALREILTEWLVYMEHLRTAYPFLFSFALRSSPFSQH